MWETFSQSLSTSSTNVILPEAVCEQHNHHNLRSMQEHALNLGRVGYRRGLSKQGFVPHNYTTVVVHIK